MHDGFVCDTCGYTSSEEVGTGNTYYCPKCGTKMHPSRSGDMFGNGGDANANKTIILWDLLYLIFVGGLSFGIVNYISYWTDDLLDIILLILWLVLFIVSFVYFHKIISGPMTDKAIRK